MPFLTPNAIGFVFPDMKDRPVALGYCDVVLRFDVADGEYNDIMKPTWSGIVRMLFFDNMHS